MLGPIDYVAVGFEDFTIDGSIMEELMDAVNHGTIRVVDLFFIMKEKSGDIAVAEYSDQPQELQDDLSDLGVDDTTPLFTEEDINSLSEAMKPGTATAVLVVEHLWAKALKQAIINKGGVLLADGRIHPEAVKAAEAELQTSAVA